MGVMADGSGVSFLDRDEDVLKLIVMMVAQLREYSKNH